MTMEILQAPSELAQMKKLYLERKPRRVLEIGSWDGGTLKVWLENAAPGTVVAAVDLEHRNAVAYKKWVRQDITLQTYVGSSLTDEGREFIVQYGPYDWMLIDGDHSQSGAEGDVYTCIANAAAGALMLIHDITPGDNPSPPEQVFARLSGLYETWSFQDPEPRSWSQGIGVVQL